MSKQVIEPYTFQCKTNIEEHNDMVNKINEIVDVVNGLDVEEITKDITALESEVSAQGNEIDAINTEIAELPTKTDVSNADVTAVAVDKTNEGIEIQLTRPAGVLEDSVALPFINTATLIPTSTERAFKIRFTYTDGTQYDTNEFVIPEGGGTDVSVTGVTVEDGTAPNSFKVAIQLSDASTIASNDYEIDIPAQQNTYPTSVSGTLSGSTLNLTIGLNNSTNVTGTADLSAFLTKIEASTTYATKTEVTAVDTKVEGIGVTSEGNNVTVNGSSATIVKSVSGQVTDGNLKITVNGVESGDIPLPNNAPSPTIITETWNTNNYSIEVNDEQTLVPILMDKEEPTLYLSSISIPAKRTSAGGNALNVVFNPNNQSLMYWGSGGGNTRQYKTILSSITIPEFTENGVGVENGTYIAYPVIRIIVDGDKLALSEFDPTDITKLKIKCNVSVTNNVATVDSFKIPAGEYILGSSQTVSITGVSIKIVGDRMIKIS